MCQIEASSESSSHNSHWQQQRGIALTTTAIFKDQLRLSHTVSNSILCSIYCITDGIYRIYYHRFNFPNPASTFCWINRKNI